MFGDSNGQIKLRAKQKMQVSFSYSINTVIIIINTVIIINTGIIFSFI